jgi:hypothetical protein
MNGSKPTQFRRAEALQSRVSSPSGSTGLGTPSSHAQQFDYRGQRASAWLTYVVRMIQRATHLATELFGSAGLLGNPLLMLLPDWMRPPECATGLYASARHGCQAI